MSLPAVTREYRNPEAKGHRAFKLTESPLSGPKAHEVLVKIHACSIQHTDLTIASGAFPPAPNVVPMSDFAGEVVAIGEGVTGFKIGDRVSAGRCLDHVEGDVTPETMASATGFVIDGVLTEYRAFPPHSLVHIPDHLTYEEASTLPCTAVTAWNCLYGPVPLKAGDTVLLIGTGGVSIAAIQFAIPAGAEVIVTSSQDKKLEFCKKLGVQHTINYRTNPNWEEEVLKITKGRGVDHVLELGGGTLPKSLKAVKMNGWIHAVGFMAGNPTDVPIQSEVIMKSILFRGVFIGPIKALRDLNKVMSLHKIKPIVDRVFPFEEAIEAFNYLEKGEQFGKVIIKVSKN
jgi:NADPH:quinone reductase-like Zn-dependent oxidoreductase